MFTKPNVIRLLVFVNPRRHVDPISSPADELAGRLRAITEDEHQDPSRRALTSRELAAYVGTTAALCLLGLLVMVL